MTGIKSRSLIHEYYTLKYTYVPTCFLCITDVPNFAIILTDGNSNITPERTMHAAVAARISGIHIFTVSVGDRINRLELQGMASFPTKNNIFNVDSYEELTSLATVLPTAMCDGEEDC